MSLAAIDRDRARTALLALDVVACGVAPSMAKNGRQIYGDLRKALGELAQPALNPKRSTN